MQIIGRVRLSPSIREAVRPGLAALIAARPELEIVRLLCDGERVARLAEQQDAQR